ncbi:hypothetical protein C4K68_25380 [Pokkaliibacter plantistimulans]|uniref:Sulfotransferase family protein n=1 Tax=Proteobacteria bacterium 228 TaxID=2083153 RepID=A0A2S5KIN9_9PROT|nr:sulfotransferase family 2 domain-containing protein [Pokkaliibacter plantistimulans]PPC74648.1 hypothetical protein C4K68_25380 [Pokkaliibacter plantistimulans]
MPVFSNERLKILFVHIPKAAGSTIENIFLSSGFKMSLFDDGRHKHSVNNFLNCSPQHFHADLLRSLINLEKIDYIFTVLRDPVSRIRSEYCMRNRASLLKGSIDNVSADEWISQTILDYQLNSYVYDNHIRPQNEFTLPGSDIFKLENGLESIISVLQSKLSVSLNYDERRVLDSKSHSGVSSKSVSISDETLVILKDFYLKDYELLQRVTV